MISSGVVCAGIAGTVSLLTDSVSSSLDDAKTRKKIILNVLNEQLYLQIHD